MDRDRSVARRIKNREAERRLGIMITVHVRHILERWTAAVRWRVRNLTERSVLKGPALRIYLALAATLGLGLCLAAADAPNPTPGPSQAVLAQNKDANGFIRVHEQGTAN